LLRLDIFKTAKGRWNCVEKGLLSLATLNFFARYTTIKEQHQINEEIRDKEVRVISAEGEQLGIMSAQEALRIAEEADLDLVKISPNAVPPVCKIMNYGKFKFEQAKREKENRKNQKVIELKEIYLSMTIDVGDLNVKAKKTVEMLGDGNKVKVSIRMRGRQMAHAAMGIDVMNRFFELLGGKAVMDKAPKTEGRNILMILAPAK
jgi:translation initiation factor IF-3